MHGEGLYGKVDEVPGLFHVATLFTHVNLFPCWPHASWLVFEVHRPWYGLGERWSGVPLKRRRWKSMLIAWARAFLWILILIDAVFLAGILHDRRPLSVYTHDLIKIGAVAAAVLGVMAWTYRSKKIRFAGYERAVELAELAGLPEEMLVRIEVHFGRVSAEDAARTLDELQRLADEARTIAHAPDADA